MRTTAEDSKLFLYRFDHPTISPDRIPLDNADQMHNAISRAMKEKETITIVDEEGNPIFRSELGVVCWPRIKQ